MKLVYVFLLFYLFIYLFHSTSCFYLYFKISNHDDQFHATAVLLGVEKKI